MGNLIAKVMSRESMLDSDPRKSFKLIPVPADHEVEFQRTEIANVVNMLFTALYGDARGTLIPLVDCGKVYILQDGKTVSTFDPDPKPTVQLNVQGEMCVKVGGDTMTMSADTITLQGPGFKLAQPVSQVINVRDLEGYKQLKADLDMLTPRNAYPWVKLWNDLIASALAVGHSQVLLPMSGEEPEADNETVNRYLNRVRDALLNAKEMIGFRCISWVETGGATMRQLTFFLDVTQTQNLTMIQTHKQILLDHNVSGLVLNNIQRAVKLLNHGAATLIASPKLKVSNEEIEIIKRLFRDAFGYSVKFNFEGDLLVMMMFDKITQTGPAL